ncbi:MAG: hypothetical protein JWR55_2578 [Aeromicrobium sp.]|jgi:uncharacterized protein (TIGR03084 family)|nr:hypothetical protein [Aeromicrobium sp.]
MSTPIIEGLVEDLAAEKLGLVTILSQQPPSAWSTPTPAPRWAVHDQVAHLAHFDHVTRLCVSDPLAFIALRDEMGDLQTYVDAVGPANTGRTGAEMLQWWDHENLLLRDAALVADPTERVPWFGPSMSLASKLTARIMETWAHGQDVVDALGVVRPPTSRLKHVARIGVLAFPNSFVTRGLDVPDVPVSVSLEDPEGGEPWRWGDEASTDSVSGPAEDFCLVVTQRRHVDDTRLSIRGDVARRWMEVAQAFAGPAGDGRQAGQFGTPSGVA